MLKDEVNALLQHNCPREEIVSVLSLRFHPDSVRKALRVVTGKVFETLSSGDRWAAADDARMVEFAERGASIAEMIPAFPGRSPRAVHDRLYALGLRKRVAKRDPKLKKRVTYLAEKEAAEMELLERRVRLFNLADGLTREQVRRVLPHEPREWLDEELAALCKVRVGHPPILSLGRDGVYRKRNSVGMVEMPKRGKMGMKVVSGFRRPGRSMSRADVS